MLGISLGGLQKTSLIDYPGCIASVVFTRGCNFRCPYCHNPELVYPEQYAPLLECDYVLDFLRKGTRHREAVVVSGGEPTIHKNIYYFLKLLKDFGYLVKLDTNGSYPDVLNTLIKERFVDYVAIDVKAPKKKYTTVAGTVENPYESVMKSVDLVLRSGLPYEFRTVFDRELLVEPDIEEIRRTLPKGVNYKVKGNIFQQSV